MTLLQEKLTNLLGFAEHFPTEEWENLLLEEAEALSGFSARYEIRKVSPPRGGQQVVVELYIGSGRFLSLSCNLLGDLVDPLTLEGTIFGSDRPGFGHLNLRWSLGGEVSLPADLDTIFEALASVPGSRPTSGLDRSLVEYRKAMVRRVERPPPPLEACQTPCG